MDVELRRERDLRDGDRPMNRGGLWTATVGEINYAVYVSDSAEASGTRPLEEYIADMVRRRLAANRADRGPWQLHTTEIVD